MLTLSSRLPIRLEYLNAPLLSCVLHVGTILKEVFNLLASRMHVQEAARYAIFAIPLSDYPFLDTSSLFSPLRSDTESHTRQIIIITVQGDADAFRVRVIDMSVRP